MGASIVSAVAGPLISSVLGKAIGGNAEKKQAKAATAETNRLNAEAAAQKAETVAKEKKRRAQRPQTDVIFGGADAAGTAGVGNFGG